MNRKCTLKAVGVGFSDWMAEATSHKPKTVKTFERKMTTLSFIKRTALAVAAVTCVAIAAPPVLTEALHAEVILPDTVDLANSAAFGMLVLGIAAFLYFPYAFANRLFGFIKEMCERGNDIITGKRKRFATLQ